MEKERKNLGGLPSNRRIFDKELGQDSKIDHYWMGNIKLKRGKFY